MNNEVRERALNIRAAFEPFNKATEDNQETQSFASSDVSIDNVEVKKAADDREDINAKGKEEGEELIHPRAEKKYSDDDVDEIVKKRLAREREKFKKMLDEEHHETELQKRERDLDYRERKADVIAKLEKDELPVCLAGAVNCSSDEEMADSYKSVTEAFRGAYMSELKKFFITQGPTYRSGGTPSGILLGEAFKPKIDETGRVIGSADRKKRVLYSNLNNSGSVL